MGRILHGLAEEAAGMQRVALCISGHFRDFEVAWPSLKRHVIDVYKPDVFAHAWSDSFGSFLHKKDRNHPSFRLGYDPNSQAVPKHYIDMVARRLNPKALVTQDPDSIAQAVDDLLEANKQYEPDWEWHRSRPKYQMMHGRTQCIKLKQRYEQGHGFRYDRVIFTRWDIVHEEPLPAWAMSDHRVLIPARYSYVGPADIWAVGSSQQMDSYGSMLDQYDEVKKTPGFCSDPHLWLRDHLDHNKVEYMICGIPVMIANRVF